MKQLKKVFYVFLLVLLAGQLPGCGAKKMQDADMAPVFYPEEPNLPRYQFLASFTSSSDIEQEGSKFDAFVTGKRKIIRRLDKPYGVSLHDGKIYVCDTNDTVRVFDLKNNKYSALEGSKGIGKVVQPLNISIDQNGLKYVSDPVRGQVIAYDSKDFYVKAYGEPGAWWKPVDAVPYEGFLYVADAKNKEIKVFDLETGKLMTSFGRKENSEDNLAIPTNVAIDEEGYIYVSDAGRFQILKYDRDGHLRDTIGKAGQGAGFFARPRGVAVDKKGRLYAVDAAFNTVQVFRANGNLLTFFGKGGKDRGEFNLPAEVAIDYDSVDLFKKYAAPNFEIEYLVIVTSQFGDRMVNVFGFGQDTTKHYPTEEELRKQMQERMELFKKQQEKETGDQGGK